MAKRKVLVTGSKGMLATDFIEFLRAQGGFELFAPAHAELDITDKNSVNEAIASFRPDVVINTPCLHVEPCEGDPSRAFAINGWGPRLLARASERYGATLVQISTCGLFGDEIRAYHEYDDVVLKTVYARSKYAGEQFVSQFCEHHFIVRLGWLYGGQPYHARNFIVARYREAVKRGVMQSAGDKYGTPTYTSDAAQAILRLLETEEYGLYHVANRGGCSRAGYVSAILEAFQLGIAVEEVSSRHFPRQADVPDCEILTTYNLDFAGFPALPPWDEALAGYVDKIRHHLSDSGL